METVLFFPFFSRKLRHQVLLPSNDKAHEEICWGSGFVPPSAVGCQGGCWEALFQHSVVCLVSFCWHFRQAGQLLTVSITTGTLILCVCVCQVSATDLWRTALFESPLLVYMLSVVMQKQFLNSFWKLLSSCVCEKQESFRPNRLYKTRHDLKKEKKQLATLWQRFYSRGKQANK